MTVDFKFQPRQFVRVTAYGLGYAGRITRCCIGPARLPYYGVEYAFDGKIENREFEEDELEDTKP